VATTEEDNDIPDSYTVVSGIPLGLTTENKLIIAQKVAGIEEYNIDEYSQTYLGTLPIETVRLDNNWYLAFYLEGY
jgi:hypothetical protein